MTNKKLIISVIALSTALSGCGSADNATPMPVSIVSPASVANTASPTMAASIETVTSIPARQGSEAGSHTGQIYKDITYCTMGGIALKLDLYFPQSMSAPAPVVVYVHGGGWTQGSRNGQVEMLYASALPEAGFILASVDYRLAPQHKFPAMIEDVKCAIRFLRARAAEYNIDPERIGAMGASAGGHLVSLLGVSDGSAGFDMGEYLDQSSRVQAVVDLFGPADLTAGYSSAYQGMAQNVFGTTDPAHPVFMAASPVTYITPDDPPFLILHGDRDQTVPLAQSQELYDKLIAGGVDAQLVIVRGGSHGLTDPDAVPCLEELINLTLQFLKENLS
ncbi:MAG TPA: alpha/beta hydrolase [Anaerolineales bacterium]